MYPSLSGFLWNWSLSRSPSHPLCRRVEQLLHPPRSAFHVPINWALYFSSNFFFSAVREGIRRKQASRRDGAIWITLRRNW